MTKKNLPNPANAPDLNTSRRLEQLRRLGVRRGREGLKTPAKAPSEPPAIAESSVEPAGPQSIERLAGGDIIYTPHGPCLVVERRYPLAEARGSWPLGAALTLSGAAVAACGNDPALAGFDFAGAAFLDTETTGLAGGAGTLAFMVGVGTFEWTARSETSHSTSLSSSEFLRVPGDAGERRGTEGTRGKSSQPALEYVVRQVFMRNPAEERALLHAVSAILARCTALVTFNGRAFDAPLLEARYVMHHESSPLAGLPHLDLLPPARRRWRQRLASCALGSLEQHVLAFQRSEEDVPGWLIPSLYQDYARGGDPAPIARVFYHNREDIVNMAPLAAALTTPFEENGRALTRQALHPVDSSSLGCCYEELGWLEAGEAAYRRALEHSLPAGVRALTLNRLGWLLKRQERRDEALAVWNDWITSVPGADTTPYVELAKHYEWVEIDLAQARKWTLWGLHVVQQMPKGASREQSLAELQHRLARLERKLAGAEVRHESPSAIAPRA